MIKPHHPRATEATIKYFIIQTTASALILSASTINALHTAQWSISSPIQPYTAVTITIGIILKLGVAPTHLWYIEVLQGLTIPVALLLTTWQKIAPLTLLYLTINQLPINIVLVLGLLSTTLGGLLGLNQTQVRKIIACSSISHMGWLIATLAINSKLTTLALLTYIIITMVTFNLLITTKTKSLKDLGNAWPVSPPQLTLIIITLLSLAGMPPLTGFIPKLLILKSLIQLNITPIATALALASLPSIFFYVRITYITVLTQPPNTTAIEYKWRFKPHPVITLTILNTTPIILLPIAPILYNTL